MILQALTAYYEQLVRQGKLSAPGWDDSFKVSYELRLNDAGQLVSVLDLRTETKMGKKTVLAPRAMRVPAHVKRTAGVSANPLCDNSSYHKRVVFIDRSPAECYNSFRVLWIGEKFLP